MTYNHSVPCCLGIGVWKVNAARTLEMEKEVFEKFKAFSNPANMQNSWPVLVYTMDQFNNFEANEKSKGTSFKDKIAILNNALKKLGYKDIDITYQTGNEAYDIDIATKNRGDALNMLKPGDYIGTILPQGAAALPK